MPDPEVLNSPIDYLPLMLVVLRILSTADKPLNLTAVLLRIQPDLGWRASKSPSRDAIKLALNALIALEMVVQRRRTYACADAHGIKNNVSRIFNRLEEEEDSTINTSSSLRTREANAGPEKRRGKSRKVPDKFPAASTAAGAEAALKAAGVLPDVRRQLVRDFPRLTASEVTDLSKHLRKTFPGHYSPGLLVYRLRQGERAPDEQDSWITPEMRAMLTCPICGGLNCACSLEVDDGEGDAGARVASDRDASVLDASAIDAGDTADIAESGAA